MHERTDKIKLICLSLTSVWLKLNVQQKTNKEHMYNIKLIFEIDWAT